MEAAKDAYPQAVRAAALRAQLRTRGLEVHPKTIGMTLYRWTRTGEIRRRGLDWFYVPPEERPGAQADLLVGDVI